MLIRKAAALVRENSGLLQGFIMKSIKREVKTRTIYDCRCDERLEPKDDESTGDRKWSPFSLLSDTTQRSPGYIRQYCVHQRAHTRVRSCEIQAQCPRKQPSSLPCKIPSLFPGSLIVWTFYCSSDSLSTELQGHCITRETWMHPVHHPPSSSLFQPYSSTSRPPSLHGP